jgi:hypothetical protein
MRGIRRGGGGGCGVMRLPVQYRYCILYVVLLCNGTQTATCPRAGSPHLARTRQSAAGSSVDVAAATNATTTTTTDDGSTRHAARNILIIAAIDDHQPHTHTHIELLHVLPLQRASIFSASHLTYTIV